MILYHIRVIYVARTRIWPVLDKTKKKKMFWEFAKKKYYFLIINY